MPEGSAWPLTNWPTLVKLPALFMPGHQEGQFRLQPEHSTFCAEQFANWGGGGVQGQSQPSTSQATSPKHSLAAAPQAKSAAGSVPSSPTAPLHEESADTTSQKLHPARAGAVSRIIAAATPAHRLRQAFERAMTADSPLVPIAREKEARNCRPTGERFFS